MGKELDEAKGEDLLRILKAQSASVEAYCNAQTRLRNALIESRGRSHAMHQLTLKQTTLALSECIERVQENLRTLSSYQLSDRNKRKALDGHVARSKRALETIYHGGGELHPLGIPATKDDDETKTVALATLRASIAQLEIALGL